MTETTGDLAAIETLRRLLAEGTSGPWKWMHYPDGRKLLLSTNRAVIHCPDSPMTCDEADAALIEQLRNLAPALLNERQRLIAQLAECYLMTGADPDGNEDWRLANEALREVTRLRGDHDDYEQRIDELKSERQRLIDRITALEQENAKLNEPRHPNALMDWMTGETVAKRDAAFLRVYSDKVRAGTELTWDIPNTRAATLSDIADRLTAAEQGATALREFIARELAKTPADDQDRAVQETLRHVAALSSSPVPPSPERQ